MPGVGNRATSRFYLQCANPYIVFTENRRSLQSLHIQFWQNAVRRFFIASSKIGTTSFNWFQNTFLLLPE